MSNKIDHRKERRVEPRKTMKMLTLNLTFRTDKDLADLFTRIRKNVRMGKHDRSFMHGELQAHIRMEYSPTYSYDERVINGDVCYVYQSKL
jgi:hypothetical protein